MKNNKNKFTIIMVAIICMLTIYYFTSDNNNGPSNNPNENQNQDDNVSRYITDEFTVRRETLDEARQQTMSDLQSMLASSSTDADQKTALIKAISDLNFIMAKETSLETLIVNGGYDDAYVECNDYVVTVYVVSEDEGLATVNDLMKLANNHFGPEYNAEVVVIAPETN